ncbi:MAG: radical SAM protein [Pseudomonadota bacterium]
MTTTITGKAPETGKTGWKFSEILADPAIRDRWEKVRKFFFLRESTYDMTNRCNIRCDGCYYFEGQKQFAVENTDVNAWQSLMVQEKKRGITFVVLAGAEPALVPDLLEACYKEISLGAIASNGLKRIPDTVGYRIHVSVWGNDKTSLAVRKAKDMLVRQIHNYRGDPRTVFVYTFTRSNIREALEIAPILADNGCRLTFNMFSAPVGYTGDLRHIPETLAQTREVMLEAMDKYPDTIVFSHYNVLAHTHGRSLHDLFQCSYPRMNPAEDVGLGRTFRQYRADLTWDRDAACCVPDTDCADCRHYASGSAVVTARLFRHATDPETFKAWLDYVDTYLAVWVMGYTKGANLSNRIIQPPGRD